MLLELTTIPTAAGCEARVIAFIERWVGERDDTTLSRDPAGNLIVARADAPATPSTYFTAHLDHPAFVLESRETDGTWTASFRGGVRDPYFVDAPVRFIGESGEWYTAQVRATATAKPFRTCTVAFDQPAPGVLPGDIGQWALPEAHETDGLVHTDACDDLAAAAAALEAFDQLRSVPEAAHVRLLFTLAEEVGFIGATAACRLGTIEAGARIIALENSRSFPESPLGGGPIVRVGDRSSTFDPGLTAAVSACAAAIAKEDESYNWQRKLMPGGTCEATVFCAYGHVATCVCLPLGNYHNMGELDRVEREKPDRAAVALETIARSDYEGLIRLLVACGTQLDAGESPRGMVDRRFDDVAAEVGITAG